MHYNISFDIAAILVLIVLAVGMKTVLYTDTRGHKLVRIYVYSVIAFAVIDVITAYTICYGSVVTHPHSASRLPCGRFSITTRALPKHP